MQTGLCALRCDGGHSPPTEQTVALCTSLFSATGKVKYQRQRPKQTGRGEAGEGWVRMDGLSQRKEGGGQGVSWEERCDLPRRPHLWSPLSLDPGTYLLSSYLLPDLGLSGN